MSSVISALQSCFSFQQEPGLISLENEREFDRTIPLEIERIRATETPLKESAERWDIAFKVAAIVAGLLCFVAIVTHSMPFVVLFGLTGGMAAYSMHMNLSKIRATTHAEIDPRLGGLLHIQLQTWDRAEFPRFFAFVKERASDQGHIALEMFMDLHRKFLNPD